MGDMGDLFNDLKQVRQKKRAGNRDQSAAVLSRAGIVFEEKNIGAHLIVFGGETTIDFWPGTGLWIVRGENQRRYGVRKLVQFVEQQRTNTHGGGN